MIGTYVLSAGYYDAYYLKAQKVRTLIKRDFEQAFEQVDLVLTPATPSPAFRIGDKMDDPIAMWLNDVFTVTGNLAGLPGISVPAGLSADGLPLGLQLIGRPFDEATVLRAADVLERAADFTATAALTWPRGRRDERSAPHREPDPGRDRSVGGRGRARGACPGRVRGQAVLGRVHRVRRRAERPRLADRRRHAGHAAVGQPPLHRAGGEDRPRAARRDQPVLGVRAQELLLPGPAERLSDLAVRAAFGGQRQAHHRPPRRHGQRDRHHAPARRDGRGQEPARSCAPTRRWSTSTARAWR